jgi:large repetitive protein
MTKIRSSFALLLLAAAIFFNACSKSNTGDPTPTDPCAGVNVAITATITQTTNSTTSNGGINATATGGSGFTYSLNNGTPQASGAFTGLANGNYTVTAKNANGCSGSANFTVASVPCPTINVTGVVTPSSNATSNNGSIVATATGSTGFTYSITGVNGTYQASATFSNLATGGYTIFAKDANGCTGSAAFTVNVAACPSITLTNTVVAASGPNATNGSITTNATGGATPYTFSRDAGTTFQASNVFGNLAPGSYNIVAKDANGCLSTASAVTVGTNCPTITATATATNTVKCEAASGTVTINATGSTGLMYSLNGGAFQSSNVFNALGVNTYTFGVRDVSGCTTSGSASVAQAPAGPLFTQVKAIMAANCGGCHGAVNPTAGVNLVDDCEIVSRASRIRARAVDLNPSVMPPSGPISATDRQRIVDWITAGGKHNN